ncbi:(R)-mandelonitrile lyase [Actinomadura rupiterrae]|uniref:(R)-mandelonitrile lyase n=1 Tax=Actinomadura rupiterrae TaxID=559627 RepID=UPI0020A2FF78|nr:cupin domain-containing protein [Actinomadura rupiterrae]MCP2337624.1 quercetin dioxygenase-like cupin family protein [Actinomadura rupiterrae]
MRISPAPRTSASAPSEWITGYARIESLATPQGPSRTKVDSVRFAPGARTHWHRHPLGQVLVVTEGTGLVQRRGGEVETIRVGDTVRIEPGEWHWHGATPTSAMRHLAVEELPADGRTAERAEPVSDAEYHSVQSGEDEGQAPPLSRVIVMDQKLPEALATHRVEIRRITIAPGHAAGLHVHNGPVFGSIETGSAVYQLEGEPETVLEPGDVFYEPEGARVARFDAQDEGVTFLGYFLLPDGMNPDITFPDA